MPVFTEQIEKKTFARSDETRVFDKGRIELVTLGEVTFGRATLEPGWRWSACLRPIAGTEFCEAEHIQYHLSGRLHVRMQDGSELEFVAGDLARIAPGHDAWVVGEEPVVVIDVAGMRNFARKPE